MPNRWMIWSLNAMEYKTKFSPVFRPPFKYSTSEYRTSVCLFFRWFHYSDVWYSDPQWESEIQHFKIWTFWQSDFKWSSAQRVGLRSHHFKSWQFCHDFEWFLTKWQSLVWIKKFQILANRGPGSRFVFEANIKVFWL